MAPNPHGFTTFLTPRNTLLSKWNMLFEKETKEWIAFKPALGLHVYPCYSCRHMFYSKKSFLDHVNRRAIVLQYKCPGCFNDDLTFYNRCAFLLHCRKHFGLSKGSISLNNLEISLLPFGLAGFSKHPDIPYIFDVEEDILVGDTFMNSQFYSPNIEDKGKEVLSFIPKHLIINRTNQNGENQAFSLKQIAKNIPKCQFITLEALKELEALMQVVSQATEVKTEPAPEEPQNDQITFSEQAVTHSRPSESLSQSQDISQTSMTQNLSDTAPPTQTTLPENLLSRNDDADDLIMPVITKVETIEEPFSLSSPPARSEVPSNIFSLRKCTECQVEEIFDSSSEHFLGENLPRDENLRCAVCKLICPTLCSFKAHIRVHDKAPPFVCPDCGIEFMCMPQLMTHMDEVCFHMAKSIRIRCPGRRCGKIFASDVTFGPHFKQAHIETMYMCSLCKEVFASLGDCEEHILSHADCANIVKLFSCPTCGLEDMNWHTLRKHLEYHCKDLSRCIYIYMCRYCKCYFRSVQTITTHMPNCRVHKTGGPKRVRPTHPTTSFIHSKYISEQCKRCNSKMICLKANPSTYCNKCLSLPPPAPATAPKKHAASEKCICILCKSQIDIDDRRKHQKECQFARPQVHVEMLDINKLGLDINEVSQYYTSSSNSDLDSSFEDTSRKRSESSDENRPKKRQKPSKPKKPEAVNDLTAEKPIPFDGTYQCRLCEYKNTDRSGFHEHIKLHRHISTAYQCMECGECFVVKPSLIKHLLHYHNIKDCERYFTENNCFDSDAVNELAKIVKAPYLANNVKENQCKVCMEEFDSVEAHDKHFRIHGMAFLMKSSI